MLKKRQRPLRPTPGFVLLPPLGPSFMLISGPKALRTLYFQNCNRSESWMTRGARVMVTCPNCPLTCWPLGSNLAVPSTDWYCVWLNALIISHWSCRRRASLFSGKFFTRLKSQLLTPGPRNGRIGAYPAYPLGGRPKAVVLNQREKPRSPFPSGTGPVSTVRTPSPPPVISALSVVARAMPCGRPLEKLVTPENSQLSST